MNEVFDYKGYLGSAEVDTENRCLVGRLLFIRDVITYSATDVIDLEREFKAAVDDYLRTCSELGDEPDRPFKGTFHVRVSPQLHREMALKARSQGLKLDEFIGNALAVAIGKSTAGAVETSRPAGHVEGGISTRFS